MQVTYNNTHPFMIMSAAGAEDYARHSGEALSINRFRANFIISGCAAFDEDTWAEIWIGDVKLHNMKPCQRCSNTLVDPASGEKHAKFEPLRTLNKYTHSFPHNCHLPPLPTTMLCCRYRSVCKDYPGRGIYGALLGLDGPGGRVSVGDPVYVIRKSAGSLW